MRIAILGTRGIPANYSGFETSVQETSWRFRDAGHTVRVYCRKGGTGTDISMLRGVELVSLPFISGKHVETPSHTFLSLLHLVLHRVDVVQVYGAGNGWCVPFIRLFGMRVAFLVDGLDWARAKWGPIARFVLRAGARIGSAAASHTVADSLHVISVMAQTLPGRILEYVPYGAKILAEAGEEKLKDLGLKKGEYFLFVGRFVPEKNVHVLVEAFSRTSTTKPLVLVGGNAYDPAYESQLKSAASSRVLFPGYVFGKGYEELIKGCYVYIQPSALEGTSPALLAAMGAGACVLVSNIPENQETVGDSGFYFKSNDAADLSMQIEFLDSTPNAVLQKRGEALNRVQSQYSWDVVTDRLLHLFS
jgi:glycosyltransferase involved in cell wall biosynthesis